VNAIVPVMDSEMTPAASGVGMPALIGIVYLLINA